MLRVFSARVDCTFFPQPFLLKTRANPGKHARTRATMDARGTVAARTVALWVADANVAAVQEQAQLRRAVLNAQAAVFEGDRALALRLLAEALAQQPPQLPQRGARTRATMHARGTVAARALLLCVADANAAAVQEIAQLRRAVLTAQADVFVGDRALAERVLAGALGYQPPELPQRGARNRCSMCSRLVRMVNMRVSRTYFANLTARQRHLCQPCYDMQPPYEP